ncbi:MAG TPA: 3-hydroxyacyl-CoA dehydrogenase [Burkholderiaceae bacterium]|nr:3-hydroxyacyl-CoA dehydrogenase [Burkholderiaceae bacterium]
MDVETRTAAIVGAGLVGRAWAAVFARAGWRVRLFDSMPAQLTEARQQIVQTLADQERVGLVDDAPAALKRISPCTRLSDAVADAAWVQENLPEEVAIKQSVFAELDRLAPPEAILASSTSAIVASHFTGDLAGRARCLVAHPVNPPHLVPIVELCGAPWTSEATLASARTTMESIGQVPIIVRREIDGFVLNRLQGALLSEAMRLVADGVVAPDDLDKTVRDGLGLRWSFMGPFETIELNAPGGVADYCARYSGLYRRLAADPAPPSVWEGQSAANVAAALEAPLTTAQRNERSAWRDRRLLALRRHKIDMESQD